MLRPHPWIESNDCRQGSGLWLGSASWAVTDPIPDSLSSMGKHFLVLLTPLMGPFPSQPIHLVPYTTLLCI